MIKKIVLLVLFSTLIILGFMQNSFFEKNAEIFEAQLNMIESYIDKDDYINANIAYTHSYNLWNKKKDTYELLCEHEDIDIIHSYFERLGALIENKNKFSKTQTAVLKYLFNHIVDIDSFSFENIF